MMCLLWELYYISKNETDFCKFYKRDKAFCTIGRFEVTLNLIHDKFSL